MMSCCVEGCDIDSDEEITFFQFPISRSLKRKWVEAIKCNSKITSNSMICSRHFTDGDYENFRGKARLKSQVIPSVFMQETIENINVTLEAENDVDTNLKEDIKSSENNSALSPLSKDNENPDGSVSSPLNTDDSQKRPRVIEKSDENSENSSPNIAKSDRNIENTSPTNTKSNENDETPSQTVTGNDENIENSLQNITKGDENIDTAAPSSPVLTENEESKTNINNSTDSQPSTEDKSYEELCIECPLPSEIVSVVYDGLNGTADTENVNNDIRKSPINLPSNVHISSLDLEIIESNKQDIEDILANYHIKQNPNRRKRKLTNDGIYGKTQENKSAEGSSSKTESLKENCVSNNDGVVDLASNDKDQQKKPKFIEISVDKAPNETETSDCLMLLENVQVDVDPSTLFPPEPEEDSDIEETTPQGKPDPISLLTSSDDDEVIIQEPHIDTVEVSDETDEDDVPLVKLVAKCSKNNSRNPVNKAENNMTKMMWGMYEYYCLHCKFRTLNRQEFTVHSRMHSKALLICNMCNYTTASKTQFARHKRKHKDERKFRCHLCSYKARHNMSLIYHLKSHYGTGYECLKRGFKCAKCNFTTKVKREVVKHVRFCGVTMEKYYCDLCEYETVRKSDLKRHLVNKHKIGDRLMIKCGNCPYETKRALDMKRHRSRKHRNNDDDEDYVP